MTYSTPAAAAAPTGPRRAAAAAAVLLLGACCVALSVRAPAGWSADVLHSAAQPAAGLEAAAPLMGKNGKKLSKHALEVRIAHAQAKVEKFKKAELEALQGKGPNALTHVKFELKQLAKFEHIEQSLVANGAQLSASGKAAALTAVEDVAAWEDTLDVLEGIQAPIEDLKKALTSDDTGSSVSLSDIAKTNQNTCLNKHLAKKMSLWNEEKIRNQGVLGDAFEDENTGKDAYANARNKVALMDKSYLPVSAAQAELRLLSGFMHANEVLEAEKWLIAQRLEDAMATGGGGEKSAEIMLLTPSSSEVDAATTFVEHVKTDFPTMVMDCYVEDCTLGKGFYRTEAGPKCNACEAGTSWSGSTDDQPCATVRSSCPAGYGYGPSTSAETDATCTACAAGTFSDKDSSDACAAHAVTSCPAGQELSGGSSTHDGTCTACPKGTFKAGVRDSSCAPFTARSCSAGLESKAGSATEDTSCVACADGTFSVGGGAACMPHGSSECSAGFQHVGGAATAAHTCEACPAGKYQSETSGLACKHIETTTCPENKYLIPSNDGQGQDTSGLRRLEDSTFVKSCSKHTIKHGYCPNYATGMREEKHTLQTCEARCESTDGCKEGYFDANTDSCWIFGTIGAKEATTCGGETCGSWSASKCETLSKFTCTEPPAGSPPPAPPPTGGGATSDGVCLACATGTGREGEGTGPCVEVSSWFGPFEMSYERQTDLALGCHKCGGLAPCQAMAVEVGANAMNMIGKGGWAGAACFYVYDLKDTQKLAPKLRDTKRARSFQIRNKVVGWSLFEPARAASFNAMDIKYGRERCTAVNC